MNFDLNRTESEEDANRLIQMLAYQNNTSPETIAKPALKSSAGHDSASNLSVEFTSLVHGFLSNSDDSGDVLRFDEATGAFEVSTSPSQRRLALSAISRPFHAKRKSLDSQFELRPAKRSCSSASDDELLGVFSSEPEFDASDDEHDHDHDHEHEHERRAVSSSPNSPALSRSDPQPRRPDFDGARSQPTPSVSVLHASQRSVDMYLGDSSQSSSSQTSATLSAMAAAKGAKFTAFLDNLRAPAPAPGASRRLRTPLLELVFRWCGGGAREALLVGAVAEVQRLHSARRQARLTPDEVYFVGGVLFVLTALLLKRGLSSRARAVVREFHDELEDPIGEKEKDKEKEKGARAVAARCAERMEREGWTLPEVLEPFVLKQREEVFNGLSEKVNLKRAQAYERVVFFLNCQEIPRLLRWQKFSLKSFTKNRTKLRQYVEGLTDQEEKNWWHRCD